MARILSRNKYEEATARLKKLNQQTDPNERLVEIWTKKQEIALAAQHDRVVLGGLHRIKYTRFEHDPVPLALFMSYKRPDIACAPAINLHYLTPKHRQIVLRGIKFYNGARLRKGLAPIVTWDMVKAMAIPDKAYRLYKYNGIMAKEYIPVADWLPVAKDDHSRWAGKFYGPPKKTPKRGKRPQRGKRRG